MINALDLAHGVSYAPSLPAARRTATANGAAVDTVNAREPIMAAVLDARAAISGTNPTLNVTLEESEDGSTGWGAIPADALINPDTDLAATFSQVTNANSLQVLGLRTQLLKRYLRAVGTIGGTSTPTFDFGVTFVFNKRYS